ncbi:MAG: SEC-C metal-binding domain-containing protein [Gammaproteobacteria bacterium]|nr:SEC-C metal-binding domain-containing protein [Gammaproteobacteria bacterium]
MKPKPNQPCPCGSDLKFKRCCGKASDEPVSESLANSSTNILTFESSDEQGNASSFEINIIDLLSRGNLPQAEILLRMSLESDPNNPKTYNLLGRIAFALNLPQFSIHYFSEAARLAPDWQIPRINLAKVSKNIKEDQANPRNGELETKNARKAEQFLLIKAWGYGFWSDVSHVLGQLLVAEITGRIPIVHWGSNSLFGDGTDSNAFEFYFEKLSAVGVSDLQKGDFDFWPPKWDQRNLTKGEVNKWTGPFSRMAGLYFLNRPEKVVVSDFYTGFIDLRPWIPVGHNLYGLSVDELYRNLVRRYLRPRKAIVDEVDSFYAKHLASSDFVAMHVRGSDKVIEMSNLDEVNKQYTGILDRYLSVHKCHRIFLMTDDSRILEHFTKLYGNEIITTDCRRTSTSQGIHYQAMQDGRRLGTEVMVDTYLAAKARAFIGNGSSNPSLIVQYLKDWSDGDVHLIGQSMYNRYNTLIHSW